MTKYESVYDFNVLYEIKSGETIFFAQQGNKQC